MLLRTTQGKARSHRCGRSIHAALLHCANKLRNIVAGEFLRLDEEERVHCIRYGGRATQNPHERHELLARPYDSNSVLRVDEHHQVSRGRNAASADNRVDGAVDCADAARVVDLHEASGLESVGGLGAVAALLERAEARGIGGELEPRACVEHTTRYNRQWRCYLAPATEGGELPRIPMYWTRLISALVTLVGQVPFA